MYVLDNQWRTFQKFAINSPSTVSPWGLQVVIRNTEGWKNPLEHWRYIANIILELEDGPFDDLKYTTRNETLYFGASFYRINHHQIPTPNITFLNLKSTIHLVETGSTGQKRELSFAAGKLQIVHEKDHRQHRISNVGIKNFLTKVFLPVGYPKTVTPGKLPPVHVSSWKFTAQYLTLFFDRYQVLNALQAFCTSLASLLSSRAVLEGIGVGNPSATSTQAMLLSVLQDAFGRITTIVGAYYLGTSLVPEAKTYRFLADILNDLALIIDVFSPVLSTLFFPGARVVGLCTSAALRALCGLVAGGSKTAITLHFATPATGLGDLGDLNAKDSSKETVLALVGMLLGSIIVPLISSLWATYTVLFTLVILHLWINYVGVRGVAFRHLNGQRAAIAWLFYRTYHKVASPVQVAEYERIFDKPGTIRDPKTGHIIGRCHMGSALIDVLRGPAFSTTYLQIFERQKYLLCFDPSLSLTTNAAHSALPFKRPSIHICFRDGFMVDDQLVGWLHAVELCRLISRERSSDLTNPDIQVELINASYLDATGMITEFKEKLQRAHWNMSEIYLMSGTGPAAVLSTITHTPEKKVD